MRLGLIAIAAGMLVTRAAAAQLVAAPDANPVGTWRGTSACVGQATACRDETIVYRIVLKGANDSLAVDARKMLDGREEGGDTLACELNAARAYITCAVPTGKWRFRVRHDSLIGQLRLRDGILVRDLRAIRSTEGKH